LKHEELLPEAEDLLKTLESQRQEDPPTIIRRQQQEINKLLRVVGQQGTTIIKLHKQIEELQQPLKLRIESMQALFVMLQETIERHTGIIFPLGKITLPREHVRTKQIRALLQAIQPLRLADHSTQETSKFITSLIPKLARLLERYPSAEEIIPSDLLTRTFTF